MRWRITKLKTVRELNHEARPVKSSCAELGHCRAVIELGVTPVAVPDIAGYSDWVVQPAIPEGVAEGGTRTEPNFSALKEAQTTM